MDRFEELQQQVMGIYKLAGVLFFLVAISPTIEKLLYCMTTNLSYNESSLKIKLERPGLNNGLEEFCKEMSNYKPSLGGNGLEEYIECSKELIDLQHQLKDKYTGNKDNKLMSLGKYSTKILKDFEIEYEVNRKHL